MGLDHSEGRVSPSWFLCSGILWDSFSRQFVDMMGVNGLCLLLTADSVFPMGFWSSELWSVFGASAALPAGREECCQSGLELGMEQGSPALCPSALLVLLLLPSPS